MLTRFVITGTLVGGLAGTGYLAGNRFIAGLVLGAIRRRSWATWSIEARHLTTTA